MANFYQNMARTANKTLILLSLLLISCQSPSKSIPDTAFSDVNIYFNKDTNDCASVVAVTRKIPKMKNIEALTLGQLFEGPNEEGLAYTSPFSTATKDILLGFNIVDKKAYVNLKDIRPLIANSSCIAAEIFAQMDSTLKQFETINETLYAINGSSEDFYEWFQMEAPESFPDKF